ncbi:MAG: alkaline phosphatase [Lachnospiraceae bacterium]|nr:alkaline phosphatase [Lachnospiraceae bacterium]
MKRKYEKKLKKIFSRSIVSALSMALVTTMLPAVEANTYLKAEEVAEANPIIITGGQGAQIKNVIYMIPDGGGFPSYDIAKAVKKAGQSSMTYDVSTKWTSTNMYLDDYFVGSCTTKSANNSVTDSAAAGTALACGKKTNNGMIGITANGKPIANLLEMSQLQGKATGIVVRTYSSDATPGAFAAHVLDRSSKNEVLNHVASNGINVVLGGCTQNRNKVSAEEVSKKYDYNLVKTASELDSASQNKYTDPSTQLKLWGDFDKGNKETLTFDLENKKEDPTLKQMTEQSINLLKQDKDGFFLMVEGSRIDKAAHEGKISEVATDWIAFDEAFKVALDFASKRADTMIVVVPDHNTAITKTPDETKMQEVVKHVQEKTKSENVEFAPKKSGSSSYPHTNAAVGIWMYLPKNVPTFEQVMKVSHVQKERGNFTADNVDIPLYIEQLIANEKVSSLKEATQLLYVDVTKYGKVNGKKFTFNDGSGTVKFDSDEIIIGEDTFHNNGELNLYIKGTVYIPQSAYTMITKKETSKNCLIGDGSKTNPYIVSDDDTFEYFISSIKKGETYEGKYIIQTENIELADDKKFVGSSEEGVFAGTYNGQGHSIDVAIVDKANQMAIFPTVTGTIYNFGVTGTITNTTGNGNCAGIAVEVSDGGKIAQSYCTADISAKNQVAGIAVNVEKTGVLSGCYYSGLICGKDNFGVANGDGSVNNCYYYIKHGSTATVNDAKGTVKNSISVAELNANKNSVANDLGIVADALCNFFEVKGVDIAFEAGVSNLKDVFYSYTTKEGSLNKIKLNSFNPMITGYQIMIEDAEIDPFKPIHLEATIVNTGGISTLEVVENMFDSKGIAIDDLMVKTTCKNDYYQTNSYKNYNIVFYGPVPSEDVIVTPKPTATLKPTKTPTATPKPTKMPTAAATPKPTKTPKPTETPKPTATPKPTKTPTATPKPTKTPKPTATPKATPVVTATSTVASMSGITVSPSVEPIHNKSVVYYRRSEHTSWDKAYIHYKVNGSWTKVPGVKMTEVSDGYWKYEIDLGEEDKAVVCFNNGKGIWDNNNTQNYKVKMGTSVIDSKTKKVSLENISSENTSSENTSSEDKSLFVLPFDWLELM